MSVFDPLRSRLFSRPAPSAVRDRHGRRAVRPAVELLEARLPTGSLLGAVGFAPFALLDPLGPADAAPPPAANLRSADPLLALQAASSSTAMQPTAPATPAAAPSAPAAAPASAPASAAAPAFLADSTASGGGSSDGLVPLALKPLVGAPTTTAAVGGPSATPVPLSPVPVATAPTTASSPSGNAALAPQTAAAPALTPAYVSITGFRPRAF